jgi:hypothetical protein
MVIQCNERMMLNYFIADDIRILSWILSVSCVEIHHQNGKFVADSQESETILGTLIKLVQTKNE